jgi:hypothetical protein
MLKNSFQIDVCSKTLWLKKTLSALSPNFEKPARVKKPARPKEVSDIVRF